MLDHPLSHAGNHKMLHYVERTNEWVGKNKGKKKLSHKYSVDSILEFRFMNHFSQESTFPIRDSLSTKQRMRNVKFYEKRDRFPCE